MSGFAGQIATIDKSAGEVVAIEGLLHDGPFIKLANEGPNNIEECVRFLAEREHPPQQRTIAILAMHRLTFQEYVLFLRKLIELFDKGLVSRNELGLAVIPTYAFSTVLIDNFAEDSVQSVLKEIAARKEIRDAARSAIERILSGKAAEELRTFRQNCCSAPSKGR